MGEERIMHLPELPLRACRLGCLGCHEGVGVNGRDRKMPEDEPDRSRVARELARSLAQLAHRWQGRRTGLLIGEINDAPAREHFLARFLEEAGFVSSAPGFQMRRVAPVVEFEPVQEADEDESA